MLDSPQIQNNGKSLSEEDLRVLARRHAMILRKFRARRERELARREQQALVYSLAQQMATMMSPQKTETRRSDIDPWHQSLDATVAESDKKIEENIEKTVEEIGSGSEFSSECNPYLPPPEGASKTIRFLKKMGAGSLAVSLVFHALLIFFAFFWVVSIYTEPTETAPTFFATGSGGGQDGQRPTASDSLKQRKAARLGAKMTQHKIISKVNDSQMVLPKMPEISFPSPLSSEFASAGSMRNFGAGLLSSGSGGGVGGGIGSGFGVGIGNSKNFISKFQTTQKILGTNVTAARLAVYMDSSPSMTEVMPIVRKEILKKFPKADVYEFFGCGITSIPEAKRTKSDERNWARKKEQLLKLYDREKKSTSSQSALKTALRKKSKNGYDDPMGWQKNLSSYGKALLDAWSGEDYYFRMDLGGWLNMVLTEGGYDALIVFADFQDYKDGSLMNEGDVLERWIALSRDNQQRFYFFTTEMVPQKIFIALTDYTGGEAAQPKEVAKDSSLAKDALVILRKMKRQKENGGMPPTLISSGNKSVAEKGDETETDEIDQVNEEEEEILDVDGIEKEINEDNGSEEIENPIEEVKKTSDDAVAQNTAEKFPTPNPFGKKKPQRIVK